MGVYKIAICPRCGHRKFSPRPEDNHYDCQQCGSDPQPMKYLSSWYISYYFNKKKYVEAVGPKKNDAKNRLAQRKAEIIEKRFSRGGPRLYFKIAAERFLEDAGQTKAITTMATYRSGIKLWVNEFGDQYLDRITAAQVERVKHKMLDTMKPGSASVMLNILHSLMSWAVSNGYLDESPLGKVKAIKVKNARERYLTSQEMNLLIEAATGYPPLPLILQVALHTGLRRDGVLSLKWSDISWKEDRITKTVKGKKIVHIPLSVDLRKALIAHRSGQTCFSEFVFPRKFDSRRFMSPNEMQNKFKKALAKIGLENFHFHDLRHTFATQFLKATRDIKLLKEVMGHEALMTTDRYAHIDDDDLRKGIDKLAQNCPL